MRWRISYCRPAAEWLARGVAAALYRVRALHAERLPAQGGVLLLANHLSYIDVVVLQLASRRPLRFIGYRGARPHWFFDQVFAWAGVIALSSAKPAEAVRMAIRCLQQGEVVCLFPEGQISRTGQLMRLERGFEVIARRAGVPVVGAGIDGVWGSLFSFSCGHYVRKRPRLSRTPVTVAFSDPIPPGAASVEWARRALLDLTAEAMSGRPKFERHLGWEVARALAASPGRTAVVDRTGERRPASAGAIFAAAAALGRRWRGTIAEERVGVVLPPGIGAIAANLAVLWAGKSPVNLNCTAGPDAARSAFATAGLRTVISSPVIQARFPEYPWPERTLDLRAELTACGGRMGLAPWLLAAWLLPRGWAARLTGCPPEGGDREAAILFTSGSSGKPKGVILTHRNILSNCEQFFTLSILSERSVLLGCLPIFHSFGFTVLLWCPLLRRCGLVTVPSPLDTRKNLDAIREEAVTLLVSAPTFLRPMLKKAEPAELRSLALVVSGAERLPEDVRLGFRERFQLPIYQGYGLTEMSPVTNVNQPDPAIPTSTAGPQAGGRLGSVGRLLPGVSARIVDPDSGEERPLSSEGIVQLRGPNRFAGYLGDADRTADAIRDGWFVTGDVGSFDEDGFLSIAGRRSRFSKIGGEMVPHGVVEQKLAAALGLDPGDAPVIVVVGVTDPVKGEALVLLTAIDLPPERVRTVLTEAGLPNLWIPKQIRRVEAIPVLSSGKLDLAGCAGLAK